MFVVALTVWRHDTATTRAMCSAKWREARQPTLPLSIII
jgi:hypothetical protein